MAQKKAIEDGALATKKKMEQATALIGGLAGERQRWTEDSQKFEETKKRMVGDAALGCAFVSYCGPFNQDFRDYMVRSKFTRDLKGRWGGGGGGGASGAAASRVLLSRPSARPCAHPPTPTHSHTQSAAYPSRRAST